MSNTTTYPLLKYSCPAEDTTRPHEQSTSTDHQWQQFTNLTLTLHIQAGSNGSLQSARVSIVWDHPSRTEHRVTSNGNLVLEDLDLLSFSYTSSLPAMGQNPGFPLKVAYRESLVGFRYLHPRVVPEGSTPTYRRFQISFTEPSFATQFIERIRQVCPGKAIHSQNGPVPRGVPAAGVTYVTPSKRPSVTLEPSATSSESFRDSSHTFPPNTRTLTYNNPNRYQHVQIPIRTPAIVPHSKTASQDPSPFFRHGYEMPAFNERPNSSATASDHALDSRHALTLGKESSIPSSSLEAHQRHRDVDVLPYSHKEAWTSNLTPSIVPAVHSVTRLSLASQHAQQPHVTSKGLESESPRRTSEHSSASQSMSNPKALSHEIGNCNSNGGSNPKSKILILSDVVVPVTELYGLPVDQLEKLVGKVIREPGFLQLAVISKLEKLDEMWKVKSFISRN